ncbi:MAG: hypothetical protein AAGM38_07055 [Pseudomonadota bacterium]
MTTSTEFIAIAELPEKAERLLEHHRDATNAPISKAELCRRLEAYGAVSGELRKSFVTRSDTGESAQYFNALRARDEAALFAKFNFDETTPGWRSGDAATFAKSMKGRRIKPPPAAAGSDAERTAGVSGARAPREVVAPYDVAWSDYETLNAEAFALSAVCHQFEVGKAAAIYCEVSLGPLHLDRRFGFDRCYLWVECPAGVVAGDRLGAAGRHFPLPGAVVKAALGHWLLESATAGEALEGLFEIEEALFTVLGGEPGKVLTLRMCVPPKDMVLTGAAKAQKLSENEDWSEARRKLAKRLSQLEERRSWRRWDGAEEDETLVAMQKIHLTAPKSAEDDQETDETDHAADEKGARGG